MSKTWPSLPLEEWKDTCATLHMWTQVVGKVRLAQTPLVNHWWNVPLYVSARGLTTTAMPHGETFFEMEFDFIDHKLVITDKPRYVSYSCTGTEISRDVLSGDDGGAARVGT